MDNLRTVADVISRLPSPSDTGLLSPPLYQPLRQSTDQATPGVLQTDNSTRLGLAVASMKDHTTDEGWQIFHGLQLAGYQLYGHGFPYPYHTTYIPDILDPPTTTAATTGYRGNPSVVLVQDKREWDVRLGDFRDPSARFDLVERLRDRPDIFKLTILKDAQSRPGYHRESAEEIGCHAWIIYYHPCIVKNLAPFVREEHLIRTYHTLDSTLLPPYSPDGRDGSIISGAVSSAYPLRQRLVAHRAYLPPDTHYLPHPGYHRRGCATPRFLQLLTKFKVSICTSSIYGYALRKIVESTAAGCVVVTDLPTDDVLPEIDGNLVRVPSSIQPRAFGRLLTDLCAGYNSERQADYAERARTWYDFRAAGIRLARDIDEMRLRYRGEA